MSTRALMAIAALLVACSRPHETLAVRDQASAPAAVSDASAPDPEPPAAQAKAEAVVSADFNRDKITKLVMHITTIVAQTSSLTGFATNLAARNDRIEDKLSRLGARVTDTEVVIPLPGAILFDFDSAAIRPDAERALHDVAQIIASYAARPVRVEGHTDSIAADDYNQALSERRAKSVAEWLAANGVERARLRSAGLGETKPVASNDTAAGRQANRRVEVVIAKK